MKFKREAWRSMDTSPFHEGEYDVRLASGEVIRVLYEERQWAQDAGQFTHWRGLALMGMKKHARHRHTMDKYRADVPDTHAAAAEAAHFLARRAVSLDRPFPAYRYYLILHALDPGGIPEVDLAWINRFRQKHPTSSEKVQSRQKKVDKFFDTRGGRPTQA